jgi:predicted acyl esterase
MPGLVPGIHVLILWMRQRWDRPGHDGADHERQLPLVETNRGYDIQPHEGNWPTSVAVIVTTFPRSVRVIENMLIPLKDGTKLAARMWLPDDAEQNPVPAILEYLPYRKRDGTCERDALTHPYLAGHGYAGVRVDIRGSGESEGLLFDEYTKQEQDDGLEVIAWLAAQRWCSGVVGMMGISWGGFNGLQIAARRPPALKAIVTICSTDDRYADDVHYVGGTLLTAGLEWAFYFFGVVCLPPDPMLVGDGWRAMWLQRLENVPQFFEVWLRHPRRDA